MNYRLKLLKTIWFGIKNNKVMIGFLMLLGAIIFPVFSAVLNEGRPLYDRIPGIYGCIMAYFCGLVIPTSMFGYLNKRQEFDFYNSMPVKRSQFFWGYFIAGFLIFIVPLTIMFTIHGLFASGSEIFFYYLKSIGAFLSIYCSVILAVVFSGSTTSTVVTIIIRNGLPLALVALPLIIAAVDVNAYVEALQKPIILLTPLAAGIEMFVDELQHLLLWQLIPAAIELIVAFFLHRFRQSETTMALAFPKSRYFYQYLVMLIFALGADAVLLPLLGLYETDRGIVYTDQLPSVIFLTALVIFISFILLNIILEKNSKAAFKKIRHFFFFTGGYGVLILLIAGLAPRLIPPSVLPFTPKIAEVEVYSVERIPDEETEDFLNADLKPYSFAYYYYSSPDDSEGKWAYFKEVHEASFAVTDPDKLKELVRYAMEDNRYNYSSFDILRSGVHYPFMDRGIYYNGGSVVSPMDEDFITFDITFIREKNMFIEPGDAAYRHGYAIGIENVTRYRDYDLLQ